MEAKRPFNNSVWLDSPEPVRGYIEELEAKSAQLHEQVQRLSERIEQLEAKLNQNSQNSNKPPSSDAPYDKPKRERKKTKRKRGAQKGHKGHKQTLLEPTKTVALKPEVCDCGNCSLDPHHRMVPYYTHQEIELPEIKMDITHYVLYQSQCDKCGKILKAPLPKEHSTGYGPRLSALIAEMSGVHGASRDTVKGFCNSVLGIPICVGAIQAVIDRASEAIAPIYDAFGKEARSCPINHVDETSWFTHFKLRWLWVMANAAVAYFMVHTNRSKKAFLNLIGDWQGILISDNYKVYSKWVNLRQTCLAHYTRRAKALSQRKDETLQNFGNRVLTEILLLCQWAKDPPTIGQWRAFYARFIHLVFSNEQRRDDAGVLARTLIKEMDSLWVFLEENGVEPTNNRAERALRFGVMWRKRSKGTQSEKGDRWVERILSLKQTCRIRGKSTYPILVEAIASYFKEQRPDTAWVAALH